MTIDKAKAKAHDRQAVAEAQSLITSADMPLASRLKVTAALELLAGLLDLPDTYAFSAPIAKIEAWRARRVLIDGQLARGAN